MKKKLLTLLVLCLAAALLLVTGAAADEGDEHPTYSGTCGQAMTWTAVWETYFYMPPDYSGEDFEGYRLYITIDTAQEFDGVITADGWGDLPVEQVVMLELDDPSIRKIDDNVFTDFTGLRTIQFYGVMSSSFEEIGDNNFKDCDNLYSASGVDGVDVAAIKVGDGNDKLLAVDFWAENRGTPCGEDTYWTTYTYNGETRLEIELYYGKTDMTITNPSWLDSDKVDVSKINEVAFSKNYDNEPYGNLISICDNAFPEDEFTDLKEVSFWNSMRLTEDFSLGRGNDALLNAGTSFLGAVGDDAYYYLPYYTINGKLIIKTYAGAGSATIPAASTWATGLLDSTTSIRDVTISDGITEIAASGFAGFNINTLSLPATLTKVGENAFKDSSYLTTATYAGDLDNLEIVPTGNEDLIDALGIQLSEGYCGANAKWKIEGDTLTISGTGAVTTNPWVELDTTGVTKVVIEDGITTINYFDYFDALSNLQEASIPASLNNFGGAFRDCTNLKKVTLADGVSSISSSAFHGCTALTEINFPSSLSSISYNAFQGCTALSEINFPSSLKSIGEHAFDGCTSLTSVTLPAGIDTIGNCIFQNCTGLQSVTINNGITAIPALMFKNCTSLASISLPASVTVINYEAFMGCSKLANVTFGGAVTSIGNNAFNGTAITSVTLPDTVNSIGFGVFANCRNLTSATLSDRISSIPSNAFENCVNLTSIDIPDIVTSIGDYAFRGCTRLASATTGQYVRSVGIDVFGGCSALKLRLYSGSYLQAYADAYDIPYEIIGATSETGIEDITSSTAVNPATGEMSTAITITFTDGTSKTFYLDNNATGIEDITSAPGFDQYGRLCTVITITLTDGTTEKFYIYDGDGGVTAPAFSDVPANSYYSDAVAWAVANGVTSGTSENTFSPNAACTRAQVVTFLWRAMGCPEPEGSGDFSDVPAGSYYAKAAQWALENGITTGVGGSSFGSNSTVTRAQVVTFLWRAAGSPKVSGGSFADVDSNAYYADAVAWAVRNGITTGTSATAFSPDAGCTRAQIVTFLYRYFT